MNGMNRQVDRGGVVWATTKKKKMAQVKIKNT